MNAKVTIQSPETKAATANAGTDSDMPRLPPRCSWLPDGRVRMTLEKPVELSGSDQGGDRTLRVDELVFGDLDGGAMIDMSAYQTAGQRMAFLIGSSTGHSGPAGQKIIRSLKARDYRRAEVVVDIFTDAGLQIGT